jgi:hypothetical protein
MRSVFWLLLITVVCAGALYGFVLFEPSSQSLGRENKAPNVSEQADSTDRAREESSVNRGGKAPAKDQNAESETILPEPPVAPAPEVVVDSFSLSEWTSTENWSRIDEVSGHLDVANRTTDGAKLGESVLLETSDVLVVQGWAGNYALGFRFRDILLSACGRIIARAQVGLKRPDVAKAIHPNLVPSGWRAQVLAGDLPSCADSKLRGWAVVPGANAVLAPLVGVFDYVSPGLANIPRRVSAQQKVDAASYSKPAFGAISVIASKANLRKCGSASCEVVAQIDRGVYRAHIATPGAKWSLILFPDGAGWIFNDLYRVLE